MASIGKGDVGPEPEVSVGSDQPAELGSARQNGEIAARKMIWLCLITNYIKRDSKIQCKEFLGT